MYLPLSNSGLSYRDGQELLFERGIDVTHEAIRQWCLKSLNF
jgi:transposase-like protein